METVKRLFLLALLLSCGLALQAQVDSHLAYRRYTTQDGLPQMQTERLWQDSRGYIYIGTLSGFVRFDGRSFTTFLKGRRENIVGFVELTDEKDLPAEGSEVRALGFPRQWIVDGDEVEMRPIDPEGHWLLNNLNAGSLPEGLVVLEDEQEQNRRLCRATLSGFEPLLTHELLDEMTPDRKLYVDSLGLFIPTPKGLFLLGKDKQQPEQLSENNNFYTLLRTDTALLAFASDGIYAFREEERRGSVERIVEFEWNETSFGLTVRALRNGHLVIADEHTVYLFDGRTVSTMFTGINLVRDVLIDRWDRLWVATYQGAYCFFNRCFFNHRLCDSNDIVRAMAADSTGRLVMGTLNGKVLVNSQMVDSDGNRYFAPCGAAIGNRVFLSTGNDVACIGQDGVVKQLGLPQDRYRYMTASHDQLVLVSPRAVSIYNPATGQLDTLTTAIPYAWCAADDGSGRLWVGTTLGLYSIDEKGHSEQHDLSCRRVITAMASDASRGCVFFASADSLFLIEHDKVSCLNQQLPLLAGHEVRSLLVSPRGFLVVAVIDGLLVARVATTTKGNVVLSDATFFDHHDGFTLLGPQQASMAETTDGTVWIAGLEEMISFKPAELLDRMIADTYVRPVARWWQHWWVWTIGIVCLVLSVGIATRWVEKHRNRKKMIHLQREKLAREQQLKAIRQKAIDAVQTELAQDIVRMTEKPADERLTLRTASGMIIVMVSDIAYFKGDGNYSQMVTFQGKITVLTNLGNLEKMLDKDTFVRADRSTLVNIHNISQLLPRQRRCVFRSAGHGPEIDTTLLAPAFKRLQSLLM